MWPDRVSNPGPLTLSQVPYRLRYAAWLFCLILNGAGLYRALHKFQDPPKKFYNFGPDYFSFLMDPTVCYTLKLEQFVE